MCRKSSHNWGKHLLVGGVSHPAWTGFSDHPPLEVLNSRTDIWGDVSPTGNPDLVGMCCSVYGPCLFLVTVGAMNLYDCVPEDGYRSSVPFRTQNRSALTPP